MAGERAIDANVGRLILCPTPLGNLGDMTQRALEALQDASVVYAEDTRVTGKLLAAYNIQKRLERLDENKMISHANRVIGRVLSGEVVVFCSDAGMPGISDPGTRLVAAAREAGAIVEVLPGPNAITTAYVASGFSVAQFYFGGFFPRKEGERQRILETLRNLDAALIFYESPKRLVSALQAIALLFPTRRIAVCRELTKVYEEIVCATAPEVLAEFLVREAKGSLKGEIVLVIDAASEEEGFLQNENACEAARIRAAELREHGQYSHKDIATFLREEFKLSRNDAYRIAHGE